MQKSEYYNISRLEINNWWYKANREFSLALLDKYLSVKSSLKILDAGCGTGGTTIFLQKYGKVTGIDSNPTAIQLAKRRHIDRLLLSNINHLPLSEESFDLITCFDVLYHRKVNVSKALSEIFRVLHPGGLFLVRVPAFKILSGAHDKIVHTAHRYTAEQLTQALQSAGFNIIRCTYFNWSLFIPVFFMRQIFKFQVTSDIKPVWKPLNYLLYFLLKLESFIAIHINLPWGTSVYCLCSKPK